MDIPISCVANVMFGVIWLYQMTNSVPLWFFLAAYALTPMRRESKKDVFADGLGNPGRAIKSKSGLGYEVGFFHGENYQSSHISRLPNNKFL